MQMVFGLKVLLLKLSFLLLTIFSTVVSAKTLRVDTLTASISDGDIFIQESGTGGIKIGTGSGFVKLASGLLSNQEFIDATADISGILPTANGGTGSATKNFIDLTTAQTVAGAKTFSSDILMSGTGQLDIPSGTTAQRSGSPSVGMIRHNSTLNVYEGYNSGAWSALGGTSTFQETYEAAAARIDVNDNTNPIIFEADSANDYDVFFKLQGIGGTPLMYADSRSVVMTELDVAELNVASTTKHSNPCPTMTTAQRNAALPLAAGVCVFNSTTSQFEVYDGSAWIGLAVSGGGGGSSDRINFIANGTFEDDIAGWTTYRNSGAAPTTCVTASGSPEITASHDTSTPTYGTGSLSLESDLFTNSQGSGVAYSFDIERGHLGLAMETTILTNAVNSANYSDGFMTVYIYDVTNAAMITTTGSIDILKNPDYKKLTWTASATSENYRLCIHIATTNSTSLFGIIVDSVNTKPATAP